MSRRPALYVAIVKPAGMTATTELIDSTIAIGYGARSLSDAFDKYAVLKRVMVGFPGFEVALLDVLSRRELRSTAFLATDVSVVFDPAIEVTAETAPQMAVEPVEVDPETVMVRMEPLPAGKLSEPMARALDYVDGYGDTLDPTIRPNTLQALETRGLVERKGIKATLTHLGRRMFRRNQGK